MIAIRRLIPQPLFRNQTQMQALCVHPVSELYRRHSRQDRTLRRMAQVGGSRREHASSLNLPTAALTVMSIVLSDTKRWR